MGSYVKNDIWSYAGTVYDHMSQIICRKSYMIIICGQIICGFFSNHMWSNHIWPIIYDPHTHVHCEMTTQLHSNHIWLKHIWFHMCQSYMIYEYDHMWSNHICSNHMWTYFKSYVIKSYTNMINNIWSSYTCTPVKWQHNYIQCRLAPPTEVTAAKPLPSLVTRRPAQPRSKNFQQ